MSARHCHSFFAFSSFLFVARESKSHAQQTRLSTKRAFGNTTPSKSLDAKIAYDLCIQWLGCLRVLFCTFCTLRYQSYIKVQKVPMKKNNGRMESEYIRPLIISARDTTAWFATKPWYHHLIYASVSARSRDARIHSIRYIGLVQVQQPNIPYVRYASVSASCRDARSFVCITLHRGSARPSRASMHII